MGSGMMNIKAEKSMSAKEEKLSVDYFLLDLAYGKSSEDTRCPRNL